MSLVQNSLRLRPLLLRRQFSGPLSTNILTFRSNNLSVEFSKFDWQDPLNLESQLTEDERLISQNTHDYCQTKLFPRVLEGFRHESKQEIDCVKFKDL